MVSKADVLLYYPNLIGYARFVFMVLSFAAANEAGKPNANPDMWKISVGCYLLAFVGDVVDGYVARAFNQCKNEILSCEIFFNSSFLGSKFGGVLDMVTDRVSTCGLLIILSHYYPTYTLAFVMLVVLDITSHWFHVMR